MLISIIVPVYNVEPFLSRCIESILNQDYKNLELILVNDGSKDKSGEICDKYSKIDNRVKVAHKENGGQSTARNMGISMSTGDYIVFLDSDDFWLDNKLKKMMEILNNTKSDMLMFKAYSYYESDNKLEPFSRDYKIESFKARGNKVLSNILEENYDFGWCPIWYVVKREIIINNNLVFPEGHLSEDVNYVFKLWNNVDTVEYYDEYVYAYRRENENSTTHVASFKFCFDLIQMIEENLKLFNKYSIDKKLKNLIYLNMQTLVSVVLFHMWKYNKEEKRILKEKISNISQIYNLDKEYKHLCRRKEKVVSKMISISGVYCTAWMWSIKSKIVKNNI